MINLRGFIIGKSGRDGCDPFRVGKIAKHLDYRHVIPSGLGMGNV
jgi:hypothetical protein